MQLHRYGISKYTRRIGLQHTREILTNLRFIKSGINLSWGEESANGGLLINNNNNTDTLGHVGVL